jgi:hypothetical protein
MRQHPLEMIVASVLWVGVFCTAICMLPRHTALYASLALTLGHAFGAGTWAYNYYGNGMALALTLFTAAVCTIAFELWAANGDFAPTLRKWSAYAILIAGAPAAALMYPSGANYTQNYAELRLVNQSGVSCRVMINDSTAFGVVANLPHGANMRAYTTLGAIYVKNVTAILGTRTVETVLDLEEKEISRVWLTIGPDGAAKVRKE